MTDRICIASNGTQTPHLSAQDVTSCCHLGVSCVPSPCACAWRTLLLLTSTHPLLTSAGYGLQRRRATHSLCVPTLTLVNLLSTPIVPRLASNDCHHISREPRSIDTYWGLDGIVTGGNYGDLTMCWSYQKAPCAHHSNSSDYPDCPEENRTPSCAKACTDDTSLDWDTDKTAHKGSGHQFKSVDDMLQDLYTSGPLTAQFMVYEDFLAYESGVYTHSTGSLLGGHAIKIIGFGEEDGTPYWTVANSWNEEWGDGGFFKIKRGSNECQIENFVINGGPVGGTPKL